MKGLLRFIGLLAVIALVLFVVTIFNEHRSAVLARQTRPYHLNEPQLAASINTVLAANSDLNTSVSVIDLQTGKGYHYGETASYGSASIGKLVSAAAYLHLVELGRANLDDMVGAASGHDQLRLMITKSDNTAWHAINQFVTPAGLKEFTSSVGLQSYEPTDNLLTTDDVARLLDKLAGYRLLNNTHTDLLLSLMEQANMRDYIVAAAPEEAVVYHKVGYLRDRLHDAAIIHRGDRAYVLVIFSKSAGAYDFSRGSALFRSLTNSTTPVFFD